MIPKNQIRLSPKEGEGGMERKSGGDGGRLLHKHEEVPIRRDKMCRQFHGVYGGQGEVFTTLQCLQ